MSQPNSAVEAFESLWGRYIAALEALDAAKDHPTGHKNRVRRGARKTVERLQRRLETAYELKLGNAPRRS